MSKRSEHGSNNWNVSLNDGIGGIQILISRSLLYNFFNFVLCENNVHRANSRFIEASWCYLARLKFELFIFIEMLYFHFHLIAKYYGLINLAQERRFCQFVLGNSTWAWQKLSTFAWSFFLFFFSSMLPNPSDRLVQMEVEMGVEYIPPVNDKCTYVCVWCWCSFIWRRWNRILY